MTTEDDKELASSASEDALSAESSTATVDAVDTESSSTERPEKTDTPTPSRRESLIKSLTGQAQEDDETEEEVEETTEEAVTETKNPESEKAEEVEAEPTGSKHDSSDKRSKAEKRFEVLTQHNKTLKADLEKSKPIAEYGQSILTFCKEAGLTPEKLGVVLAFGAELQRDKASAKSYLAKLGLEPDTVVQSVKEIPQELDDAILDMVTSGDITPEGMKTLIGTIRAARAASPAKPVAAAPTEKPPVQTLATTLTPDKIDYDRALARAAADIDTKDAEYANKYPLDWPKLRTQIRDAMTLYKGTHPSQWTRIFEKEVAEAIAKVKRPTAKTPALRPSSTPTAKTPPGNRASLLAELTGKAR